jgi:hypothetical protein
VSAVPIEQFGRDHWSMFAYIETLVVDRDGEPERQRMRCDLKRHPHMGHPLTALLQGRYLTRLRGGVELDDHDDWDCADDLEAAGLIEIHGTGCYPFYSLTPLGHRVAAALREHRATKKTTGSAYETFVPPDTSVEQPA